MKKFAIFSQRKELKKKSHAIVRGHYTILVFLMLAMTVAGTEYGLSTSGWGNLFSLQEKLENDPGNILAEDDVPLLDVLSDILKAQSEEAAEPQGEQILEPFNAKAEQGLDSFDAKQELSEEPAAAQGNQKPKKLSSSDVWKSIVTGRISEGVRQSKQLEEELKNNPAASRALGRTNGVLAQIVNAVGSGHLFTMLAQTVRQYIRSDAAVAGIFIIGSFLWFALIFIFLKNVYSAVVRRIFLEARVYPQVSFLDILHFAAVRKWIHASLVMLTAYIYQTLWSLTIIGGFIKMYSYYAVPYIVAENPAVSAREAIGLSRRMMNGHKMEAFLYDTTLLGWSLLGTVTFGITDLVYGNSYKMACRTEFYARIRELAFSNSIKGIQVLNDRYLFEKADRILLTETYFDVVDEITQIYETKKDLSGRKKKLADWLGLWLGSREEKKAYDAQEGRLFAIERYKKCMNQESYPQWLNPLWKRKELEKNSDFTYLRSYTVWTLFLLFLAFSFAGWSWEVALHFMQTGQLVNRGTLHGPWLPIYGTGGVLVLILCSRFRKKPVLEFISAIILCGSLEYFSGLFLEMTYHTRWWSYDGYFLNLHGRICAEGLLVFGVGCCAVVYLLAPLFDYLIAQVKEKILMVTCLVLLVIYGSDMVYSRANPNMAEGAIEQESENIAQEETTGEGLQEGV